MSVWSGAASELLECFKIINTGIKAPMQLPPKAAVIRALTSRGRSEISCYALLVCAGQIRNEIHELSINNPRLSMHCSATNKSNISGESILESEVCKFLCGRGSKNNHEKSLLLSARIEFEGKRPKRNYVKINFYLTGNHVSKLPDVLWQVSIIVQEPDSTPCSAAAILPDSLRREVSRNFADLDSMAEQLIEKVKLLCKHEMSADMVKSLINKFKERLYDLMPQLLDSVERIF